MYDLNRVSQSERQMLTQVSDENSHKDLKQLGIRSRRKQNALGS